MAGYSFEINRIIGENLKTLREVNGYSQEFIGDMLHIDRSTCSNWENAKTMPKPAQLTMLSNFYNVSIDFITSDHNNEFTLNAPPPQRVFGESFLSQLTDDERLMLLKYRVLCDNDKKKVDALLETLRNADYYIDENE